MTDESVEGLNLCAAYHPYEWVVGTCSPASICWSSRRQARQCPAGRTSTSPGASEAARAVGAWLGGRGPPAPPARAGGEDRSPAAEQVVRDAVVAGILEARADHLPGRCRAAADGRRVRELLLHRWSSPSYSATLSDTGVPLVAGRDIAAGRAARWATCSTPRCRWCWSARALAALVIPLFGAVDSGPGSTFVPDAAGRRVRALQPVLRLRPPRCCAALGRFNLEAVAAVGGGPGVHRRLDRGHRRRARGDRGARRDVREGGRVGADRRTWPCGATWTARTASERVGWRRLLRHRDPALDSRDRPGPGHAAAARRARQHAAARMRWRCSPPLSGSATPPSMLAITFGLALLPGIAFLARETSARPGSSCVACCWPHRGRRAARWPRCPLPSRSCA